MTNQITVVHGPEFREIWVRRSDGGIEYKPWFIYEVVFAAPTQKIISDFLAAEIRRTSDAIYDAESLMASAGEFWNLGSRSDVLPPRLVWISPEKLSSMPTELCVENGITFGDSVGGIASGKPFSHNAHFAEEIAQEEVDILFSPGLLCRIPVATSVGTQYVFQLAEKNLRTKGQIFYKPIGGHFRYLPAFSEHIASLWLRAKVRDAWDVAFFCPPGNFWTIRKMFLREIADPDSKLFVAPRVILASEVSEELGPVEALDGIGLLRGEDIWSYEFG